MKATAIKKEDLSLIQHVEDDKFNKLMHIQFEKMNKSGKLFRSSLTGTEVWDLYIKSFESDPKFRDPLSSVHNCNLCKKFIGRYGNIISLSEDFKIATIFDIKAEDIFIPVAAALSLALKTSKISEVFFETYDELNILPYEKCAKTNDVFQLGVDKNSKRYTTEEAEKFGEVKPNEIRLFRHMHLFLDTEFVDKTGKSIETIMGEYRDSKNVFQKAMEIISLDTLLLVKDLIIQGSLLDGQAHLHKIEKIIPLKMEYDKLPASVKDNWCWFTSYRLPFAKFKNELIGTLCTELSEGEEINKACQSWNKRVDPVNYMKTSAPITKKQIKEAENFVTENGYVESFDRRFATIDDIKVSEILHSNVGDSKIKSVSIFDGVKPTPTSRHKRNEFEGVEEVSIEKFMKDILPGCSMVEAFLKNGHSNNMVSLTTAKDKDSKQIFKWSNNYSWTFNGNLAGKSQIKEAVKNKGGNVEGVLRFSIIWNDSVKADDNSDLDAWCKQPDNMSIGYSSGFRKDRGNIKSSCSGQLDLDITHPSEKLAVENIYFSDIKKMKTGCYKFSVNQYSSRNSKGFKAEIEFDGEIFNYEYNKPVVGSINIAEVMFNADGKFTIKHLLPESSIASKEIYGLETETFHKVNLICVSPNHWNENNVGNKHYMFMLDKCKSPVSIRSFHNENFKPEIAEHRKVLEVLALTSGMIQSTDKQLSGLGFNATVKDELLVKLSGNFKRIIKIKF